MPDIKMTPKLKVLSLLVFSSFFLTACTLADLPGVGRFFGNKKPSVKEPVTLSMWGLWEPKEVMDVLITDYKSSNPEVTVEYEERSFITVKSYKEAVETRLKEGTSQDIIMVHNSWTPSLVDYLSPAPDGLVPTDDFYQVAVDSGVSGGKVYAVPFSYDGLALLYNKDMFTEAGVSSPPKTWEEFRVTASKLTKRDTKGNITQAGAAVGSANNIEHFSDILGLLYAQADVKVPDELNSQAASDVLTFYTNFVTSEKVWSQVLPPSVEAFSTGKVAMIFAPSWQVLAVINKNPQLNIGIASSPRALDVDGNPTEIDWGSFWMLAVSKNAKNPDAAWNFLKFLSQADQQRKLFSEESKLRAFGQPYALKSLQGELSGNAYLDVYVKSAATAKGGILAGRAGNDKQVGAMSTAVNSVLGGVTTTDALSAAQKAFAQ